MEYKSLDLVVEELNKIWLDPNEQTHAEYMDVCDELEDLVIELAQTADDTSKNILRNLIPAFEFQEIPTDMILNGIYHCMESDDDFLKRLLFKTELNELFEPVIVGDSCLKTPNQMFTQRTRYNIAEFLYGEEEIDDTEFAMFISYENEDDCDVVDNRDIGITAKFYKNLSDEERERMADDSEIPLLYLEQLKKLDVVNKESLEYEKAISTIEYALKHDRDLFMCVVDNYIKTKKIAKEDSNAYMAIVGLAAD